MAVFFFNIATDFGTLDSESSLTFHVSSNPIQYLNGKQKLSILEDFSLGMDVPLEQTFQIWGMTVWLSLPHWGELC